MLEKKSASIFRGWEKRWFKVDPKTFILSYHFNKDDYARGFTPRGGTRRLTQMEGDSIVLEEEIDPNYEPTEKEVLEYATWLGMDLEAERDLFWIAREGLKAG
ncbi:hypothetical protein JM18_004636 [Phytophthora kernoviae]|uniref:PH domain-containing protein n=1 Tax=Phytophthora kernoviae TaxID=325452 RepID=A0A8T0LXZ2_9STRA|nr:hypothetical protein JM16_005141 [Phytophthora kernoviae]KAG2525938.1 hypothetical protein JM18_004636 [Phytophthora kernoviae]